jgi:RIO kinase 1
VANRSRSHRRFDDDLDEFTPPPSPSSPSTSSSPSVAEVDDDDDVEPAWSTYPDASHGPSPVPPWVITSDGAIDSDFGVLKSGKEADVSLVRRQHGDTAVLMAAKRYRDAQHRLFHRDASYLEGRRMRRSRENRAMATRTGFGRELISGQWAHAEFAILGRLWSSGAAVPYPVQLLGTELLMEFIGDPDGTAAPRLAQLRPDRATAADLFAQLRDVLVTLAAAGYAHGDLSAYNVLVHDGRVVLIDLPQAVDLVGNPQGFAYLDRDCRNICEWFTARGFHADTDSLRDVLLRALPLR